MEFRLFDAATGGTQVGATLTQSVGVTNGQFTVPLDFGAGAFTGEARWLAITVQGTLLSPRQEVRAAPYALALGGLRTEPNATSPNVIGGFSGNSVTTGVVGATIGGGGAATSLNQVTDHYGTIGGGRGNRAGRDAGATSDGAVATVGGGQNNTASGRYATVGGGVGNLAGGTAATVAGGGGSIDIGGTGNRATGDNATVGGGSDNVASGTAATVAGGGGNSRIGGAGNQATGNWATVGGGTGTVDQLPLATVPGGDGNLAGGAYGFAAGCRAKATHQGAFVWADSTNADFASTTANQFSVRAGGGARFLKGASSAPLTFAALQVENATTSGEASLLRVVSASNANTVLKLLKHPDGTGNFLECTDSDGTTETRTCRIDQNGGYHTGAGDFAQALPVHGDRAAYAPGDVLVLSVETPGAVALSREPYDPRLAGVYSTRPAVLGSETDGASDTIPVGIMGIVPTKVTAENGPIAPGDLLTTAATPGHAMKATPVLVEGVPLYPTGAILGKALEPLAEGAGVIRVLLLPR